MLKVRRSDGAMHLIRPFPKHQGRDAVPTSVVWGPGSAYYVGELAPAEKYAAHVHRVVYGQPLQTRAGRFTNIIDIDFESDGSLYVLEIFREGEANVNPSDPSTLMGRLVRVRPDGTRTTIMSEGLVAPGGVEVASDGSIYVSNFSIMAGQGQVLRIRP